MNSSNKTDPTSIATTEPTKVAVKPLATHQPAIKKPTDDVKKPELTEKLTSTAENQQATTVEKPAISEPAKPVAEKSVDEKPSVKNEEPKKPTKSDKAKLIYDEMIADPKNNRAAIIARMKKEAGLTTAGVSTYYYKFQRESGRVAVKEHTKMDKAKEVFDRLTLDGLSRKDIVAAFIKEVGLTKAGASTYYQNLKKAEKPK